MTNEAETGSSWKYTNTNTITQNFVPFSGTKEFAKDLGWKCSTSFKSLETGHRICRSNFFYSGSVITSLNKSIEKLRGSVQNKDGFSGFWKLLVSCFGG